MVAKSRSRHSAMPLPGVGITVSRLTKNDVSSVLNSMLCGLHSVSAFGTSGTFMKPKCSLMRKHSLPSASISTRSSSRTQGTSRETTVRKTIRSWITLLCARLCSRACGTDSVSPTRKIEVPSTRGGGSINNEDRNGFSAIDELRMRSNRISRPRRQVTMTVKTTAPIISGNQPPSMVFTRLAERKAASTARKKAVAAIHSGSP